MNYEVVLVKNLEIGDRIFLRNQLVTVINNFGPTSCFGMIGFGMGHLVVIDAHKKFFKKSLKERLYAWWVNCSEEFEYLAENYPIVRIKNEQNGYKDKINGSN